MKTFFIILFSIFSLSGAVAGTNTINAQSAGTVIRASHVNAFLTALIQDMVPRNTSGVPTTLSGSMGSSTFELLKAFVASGHWDAGDLKYHHDFSGLTPIGQGWYPCDGTTINEASYNSFHGAGSWDTYVISSPLDGSTAPLLDNKYLVGENTVSQNGDFIGPTDHQVNIQHTHTGPSHTHTGPNHTHTGPNHNHQVYDFVALGTTANVFDSGGSSNSLTSNTSSASVIHLATRVTSGLDIVGEDLHTSNAGTDVTGTGGTGATGASGTGATGASLSATQSVQPWSMKAGIYIRVID